VYKIRRERMNELRKFLLVQMTVGLAVNISLNAGFGYYLFKGIDPVPLWGNPGIALDTLATAFLLPWLTVVIVAPFASIEKKKGTVERLREDLSRIRRSYLKHMPDGVFAQSMIIGIGTAVIATPVALGILYAVGIVELGYHAFILYKTTFAIVLTFPVNPVSWLSAMAKYINEEK
jgi:hypothetical protein